MTSSRIIFYVCIALVAFVSGCDDIANSIQHRGPVNISFNFKKDSTYLYIVDSRMLLMPEVNGKTLSIKQEMKLVATYKVLSASENQKNFTVTYTRITMSSGNGSVSSDFDSDDSTNLDPLFQPIAALIHQPFNITVSDKGLSSAQQLYTASINDSTTTTHSFGDSSLRKMMMQCLNFYPPQPVNIGDSWKRSYTTSTGFLHMRLDNTYTLKSIDNDVAHIELNANIFPEDTTHMMKFKGIQSGNIDVEISSGMILNSKISQQFKGTIMIADKQHPVDASSEITIYGNKQQ